MNGKVSFILTHRRQLMFKPLARGEKKTQKDFQTHQSKTNYKCHAEKRETVKRYISIYTTQHRKNNNRGTQTPTREQGVIAGAPKR